jgi:hypothetical protein
MTPTCLRDRFMTFLVTNRIRISLTRGNHCACLVEAVGIENIRFRAESRNYG